RHRMDQSIEALGRHETPHVSDHGPSQTECCPVLGRRARGKENWVAAMRQKRTGACEALGRQNSPYLLREGDDGRSRAERLPLDPRERSRVALADILLAVTDVRDSQFAAYPPHLPHRDTPWLFIHKYDLRVRRSDRGRQASLVEVR